MQRRDMLKRSALSLASAGLAALPASAAAAAAGTASPASTAGGAGGPRGGNAAAGGSASPDAGASARALPGARRRRPECLDIAWTRGTGLIWMAGESLFYENPRNRFMRFRRTFSVSEPLTSAELRLFADTQYIAWLNGVEIGRGPGRSDPTWALYDTYEVARHLRPGENTLAVLVLFQGYGTGGRQSIMQVLLAHLAMMGASGRRTAVVSDRSWRASPAAEFERATPRLHATLCCAEVQDRRLADEGWQRPGYDDSGWAATEAVKPSLDSTPWYHFAPEPLPQRTLTERPLVLSRAPALGDVALPPPAVPDLGGVRPPVPSLAPSMAEVRSPESGAASRAEASAASSGPATASGAAVASPAFPLRIGPSANRAHARVVTLELTRVECGFLVVDVEGPAGATIDVLSGEMLVGGRLPRPGSARVHASRYVLRAGRQRLEAAFNWIAFRVAQLWIWSDAPLTLHGVALRHLELPLGEAGRFACSEPFLNRLDAACEHTLRLCAQDGIVDSSSREQQQWIGDGRFTAITLQHRFQAGVLHRRLIEQVGQGVDWLGSLVPRFPTGNLNVAPIPLYSLQWVLAFRDYAWFTGDTRLAGDWLPLLLHVLRWFTAFERADGLLERVPHWMYIDLGEGSGHGRVPQVGVVNTTLNLHYLAGLRYAAELLAPLDAAAARDFEARAGLLERALRAALWDAAAGAYRDCLNAGDKPGTFSEGCNAHALVHLEEPGSERAARIVASVFAKPQALRPIHASPFTMNAVFAALGRHRRADLVLPLLRTRYAEQVETGTMWEFWYAHGKGADGIPVGHSMSHAWGAGALAFFVNAIAGIAPASPGWASVRIAPQTAGLAHAEASVPTPRGFVRSAWRIEAGRFRLSVELPRGVGGACLLPDGSEHPLLEGGGTFECASPRA